MEQKFRRLSKTRYASYKTWLMIIKCMKNVGMTYESADLILRDYHGYDKDVNRRTWNRVLPEYTEETLDLWVRHDIQTPHDPEIVETRVRVFVTWTLCVITHERYNTTTGILTTTKNDIVDVLLRITELNDIDVGLATIKKWTSKHMQKPGFIDAKPRQRYNTIVHIDIDAFRQYITTAWDLGPDYMSHSLQIPMY